MKCLHQTGISITMNSCTWRDKPATSWTALHPKRTRWPRAAACPWRCEGTTTATSAFNDAGNCHPRESFQEWGNWRDELDVGPGFRIVAGNIFRQMGWTLNRAVCCTRHGGWSKRRLRPSKHVMECLIVLESNFFPRSRLTACTRTDGCALGEDRYIPHRDHNIVNSNIRLSYLYIGDFKWDETRFYDIWACEEAQHVYQHDPKERAVLHKI